MKLKHEVAATKQYLENQQDVPYVARLQEILTPCGVRVDYYPPPSNEELMTIPGSDVGGGV